MRLILRVLLVLTNEYIQQSLNYCTVKHRNTIRQMHLSPDKDGHPHSRARSLVLYIIIFILIDFLFLISDTGLDL